MVVDWMRESEQSVAGGMAHTTWISAEGQSRDEQVGYYVEELREDAAELVAWWEKSQEK